MFGGFRSVYMVYISVECLSGKAVEPSGMRLEAGIFFLPVLMNKNQGFVFIFSLTASASRSSPRLHTSLSITSTRTYKSLV